MILILVKREKKVGQFLSLLSAYISFSLYWIIRIFFFGFFFLHFYFYWTTIIDHHHHHRWCASKTSFWFTENFFFVLFSHFIHSMMMMMVQFFFFIFFLPLSFALFIVSNKHKIQWQQPNKRKRERMKTQKILNKSNVCVCICDNQWWSWWQQKKMCSQKGYPNFFFWISIPSITTVVKMMFRIYTIYMRFLNFTIDMKTIDLYLYHSHAFFSLSIYKILMILFGFINFI